MDWKLEILPKAQKQIDRLDKPIRNRIISFLKLRLLTQPDPRAIGETLAGAFGGRLRYRVGDYRIICELFDDKLLIEVVQVGHRKEVYR